MRACPIFRNIRAQIYHAVKGSIMRGPNTARHIGGIRLAADFRAHPVASLFRDRAWRFSCSQNRAAIARWTVRHSAQSMHDQLVSST